MATCAVHCTLVQAPFQESTLNTLVFFARISEITLFPFRGILISAHYEFASSVPFYGVTKIATTPHSKEAKEGMASFTHSHWVRIPIMAFLTNYWSRRR